jgi:hypothetical protein
MAIIGSGLEGWNPTYNACSSTPEGGAYLSAEVRQVSNQEETNNADMHTASSSPA